MKLYISTLLLLLAIIIGANAQIGGVRRGNVAKAQDASTTAAGTIYQESGNVVAMEAEEYSWKMQRPASRSLGVTVHQDWTTATATAGYVDAGYVIPTPEHGIVRTHNNEDMGWMHLDSPSLSFPVNFTNTGTYYVWLRMYASNTGDTGAGDSMAHVGINGQWSFTSHRLKAQSTGAWVWTNTNRAATSATISVPSAGVHVINLWMRDDGAKVDRIYLSKTVPGSDTPTGNGPAESSKSAASDATAPSLRNSVAATVTGHSTAFVTFDSSEDVEAEIQFGTSATADRFTGRNRLAFRQFINLHHLEPATQYFYRVKIWDKSGNTRTSPLLTFRTWAVTTEPILPQQTMDTARATATATFTGIKRHVGPTNDPTADFNYTAAQLQTALDAANAGDVVELEPGITSTGNFTLARKTQTGGNKWIEVRTGTLAGLPAEGSRVYPATHAASMAKIMTANNAPAIEFTNPSASDTNAYYDGVAYWRFTGLEIGVTSAASENAGVVVMGQSMTRTNQMPHHIVFDRCYIHGQDDPAKPYYRGIILNADHAGVVDSYISNFHGIAAETQAIVGWNMGGAIKIHNNYLEGATENIMFGGSDPTVMAAVNLRHRAHDVTFTNNHCRKLLAWKTLNYSMKNIFEIKNGERFLIEGNIFENDYAPDQFFLFAFTPRNQYGGAEWTLVRDVTVRKNIIRHASSVVNILNYDNNFPSQATQRIKFVDNLVYDISAIWHENYPTESAPGRVLSTTGGRMEDGATSVTFDHNTIIHTGTWFLSPSSDYQNIYNGLGFTQVPYLTFKNNIVAQNDYGVIGESTGNGTATFNAYFGTGLSFTKNAIMSPTDVTSQYTATGITNNYFPVSWAAVGFVDQTNQDFALSGGSTYNDLGTDGADLGANIPAVLAATSGVDPVAPVAASVNANVVTDDVTFTWTTNEYCRVKVEYRVTGGGSYTATSLVNGYAVSHSIVVNNLAPATYDYRVISIDESGNTQTTSPDGSFTVSVADVAAVFNGTTGWGGVILPSSGYATVGSFRVEGRVTDLTYTTSRRIISNDTIGSMTIFNDGMGNTRIDANYLPGGDGAYLTTAKTSFYFRWQVDYATDVMSIELWDLNGTNRQVATFAFTPASSINLNDSRWGIGASGFGALFSAYKSRWVRWADGAVALNSAVPSDTPSGTYFARWEFENNGNDSSGNSLNLTMTSVTYE